MSQICFVNLASQFLQRIWKNPNAFTIRSPRVRESDERTSRELQTGHLIVNIVRYFSLLYNAHASLILHELGKCSLQP